MRSPSLPSPGPGAPAPFQSASPADSTCTTLSTPRLSGGAPSAINARRLSSSTTRTYPSVYSSSTRNVNLKQLVGKLLATGQKLARRAWRSYLALPLFPHRVGVTVALGLLGTLAIVILLYSHTIFTTVLPSVAHKWRGSPLGWVTLFLLTSATAFPPIIGYSTCVTASGFIYGFPGGWPLAALATIVGSAGSFVVSRGVAAGYVQRLVGGDARFVALGQVLRRDGIGVLVMVRLCPLPYSLSNGFLATVGRVGVGRFVVATGLATPKLLIHTFIGSRLALLAESGSSMTLTDRLLNYASMLIFGILGATVGWIIYRRTMQRAAELSASQNQATDSLLGRRSNYADDEDDDPEGVFGDVEQGVIDANGEMTHPDQLDVGNMGEDDISLWDTAGQEDWGDEEQGVGKHGRRQGSLD